MSEGRHMTPYAFEALQDRKPRNVFPELSVMLDRLPPHFREVTLDDYKPDNRHQDEGRTVVEHLIEQIKLGEPIPHGTKGVTLLGQPGIGKTMLVCAVLRHAYDCKKSFDFVPVADFAEIGYSLIRFGYRLQDLDEKERFEYESLARRVKLMGEVKVLALDDFGKEYTKLSGIPAGANWVETELDRIIRYRWNHGSGPTLITSNLPPEDWDRRYRSSLVSFLREMSTICHLKTKVDWRGKR